MPIAIQNTSQVYHHNVLAKLSATLLLERRTENLLSPDNNIEFLKYVIDVDCLYSIPLESPRINRDNQSDLI